MDATWLTFIHELGHNFGMDHSFDLGEGTTGGFMDYGDGLYNGAYSWNPQYTLNEFETEINGANISTCNSIGTPIADFETTEIICVGNTVEFNNYSLGDATSYTWSFQGGSPSTSIETNPLVTFSSSGQKSVSLTANNTNGPDTITKNIIVSSSSIAAVCSPSGADPQNGNDVGSTYFQLNTIRKSSGGSRTDGGYYQDYTCTDNTILELDTTYDVIISHLYQASETSYNVLFIDYNNDGDFTDANEIAYSGTDLSFSITTPSIAVVENELLRARLSVQIYTTSNNPCYQPNQNLAQIEDYGVYFLNSSTFGNVETSELTFSVYPNPSKNGNFTINLPNLTKETLFSIYNSLGQLVHSSYLQQKGENTIQLNSAIASGIYHMKLSLGERMVTKKLIIQ